MAGIVEILFDTLRTFAGCCARQERTHQFFVTLHAVEMCRKSVDKSTLIILWSTVQVRDALPFKSFESLCRTLQSDFFIGLFQVEARPPHSSATLWGFVL